MATPGDITRLLICAQAVVLRLGWRDRADESRDDCPLYELDAIVYKLSGVWNEAAYNTLGKRPLFLKEKPDAEPQQR